MAMPQRFKLAILSAIRRLRDKWYLAILFILWELLKDRFAAWGNQTIDDNADPLMKEAVRLLDWAAAQPWFWTVIAALGIFIAVFLHAYITDKTTANEAQYAYSKKPLTKDEGPVYWSLTETLSWIAFGEPKTAAQWKTICIADGLLVRPKEETHRFDQAEHELFEAFRARKLTAQGKKNKSETYEEIPHNYFLSNVACQILHDTIDVNQQAGSEMYRWDGPKWRDVKLSREAVLKLWPPDVQAQTRTADNRLRLAQLRTAGVQIRNKGQKLESDELENWKAEVSAWEQKAIDTIEEIDVADAEWFRTLDAVPPARVNCNRAGASHVRTFAQHDFRLVRLDSLIDKYGRS